MFATAHRRSLSLVAALALTSLPPTIPAQVEVETPAVDRDCLVGLLDSGADSLTLGEMRRRCALPFEAAADRL